MKNQTTIVTVLRSIILTASGLALPIAGHAESNSDFYAVPPLVDIAGTSTPNILMILDNSNSMDEADTGVAVGGDNAASKSEIARNSLKTMITNYGSSARMGLMAYKQTNVGHRHLHDSPFDVSYDSANYDPSFTGSIASTTKRYRVPNNSNPGTYVYYNIALPFYAGSNFGERYCFTEDTIVFPDPGIGNRDTSESYKCYGEKTNEVDDITGYSDYKFQTSFVPTDSDIAHGIYDFGEFMTWSYVGETWFSNSSPGKGMLHVVLDEVDATHQALLFDKLATSQFATATDTPLRNAGLTPLEGTLQSAKHYYLGTLPGSESITGNSPALPTKDVCGANDYVVLVTDGLPSTSANGTVTSNPTLAIAAVATAAAELYAEGVKTYVVGFALPTGVDSSLLDQIATAGGTNGAYLASDSASLNSALSDIFSNIVNRTSSSTGVAVLSNNSIGGGAIFQALYTPLLEDSFANSVEWTGSLNALFVDDNGHIREDTNQNGEIDDYLTDMTIVYYYDDTYGRTRAKLFKSTTAANAPDTSGTETSIGELSELKLIWKAQDQLSAITDVITQRPYASTADTGRHILTSLDGSTTIDFTATEVSTNTSLKSHMMLGGASSEDMINYIRGEEISGYRSRTVDADNDGDTEIQRLGDIVHSTPAVVGHPSALYDSVNRDSTYAEYRELYQDRRQMVYVGGNDGMVHAFNAGFWDDSNDKYTTSENGATAHPLGSELWAYIPRSALPHLQWLKDTNYQHVYYVDGEPIVFDAAIFANDADHPHGWGTVLAIGMRLGGGAFDVDTDDDGSTDQTLYSSYILLDITNPESPPSLIAEISHINMGYTTSIPAVIKKRTPSVANDYSATLSTNDWQLIFGSGPTSLTDITSTQDARIFQYDLVNKVMKAETTIGVASNAFVGDLAAKDWDSNYHDDIAYFGIVGGSSASPTGGVMRMRFDPSASSLSSLGVSTLLYTGLPTIAKPLVSNDGMGRAWIHFGTGRMLTGGDNSNSDQQKYFGVIEDASYGTLAMTDLFNSTDINVFNNNNIDDNGSAFDLPSGTPISNFDQLAAAIPANTSGWLRDLEYSGSDPSGRNITHSAKVRNVLFFTEYTPATSTCQPEGSSRLFGLDYRTGTALPHVVFDTDTTVTNNGGELSNPEIDLGRGMASAPVIRVTTNKEAAIFTQKGAGVQSDKASLGSTVTGRQTWRQIKF